MTLKHSKNEDEIEETTTIINNYVGQKGIGLMFCVYHIFQTLRLSFKKILIFFVLVQRHQVEGLTVYALD